VKDSQDSSGGVGCIEGSIRVFIEMSMSVDGYVAGPKLQRSQPALVRQKFWRWIDESDPWNRGLYRAGQILNPLEGDELVSVLHRTSVHQRACTALASTHDTSWESSKEDSTGLSDNWPVLAHSGRRTACKQGTLFNNTVTFLPSTLRAGTRCPGYLDHPFRKQGVL
jgi:hypothetical protein